MPCERRFPVPTALAKAWSRRSRMTCFVDSGLPVAQAGHCDWHRPHSVQVAISGTVVG